MNARQTAGRTAGDWQMMELPGPQSDIICQEETGKRICEFPYGFDGEDGANAAFIVTACNAHDELVAALKAALPYLDESDSVYASQDLADLARDALAKCGAL